MTSPDGSKMEPTTLPQAVAALLPQYTLEQIDKRLTFGEISSDFLAFECHKALCSKHKLHIYYPPDGKDDHLCTYGNDGTIYLGDFYSECDVLGEGDTHEEAIFEAVLDWFNKRRDG